MLTPNPNERNSTLTSETKNIYPYLYIDSGKWVAGYELSMRSRTRQGDPVEIVNFHRTPCTLPRYHNNDDGDDDDDDNKNNNNNNNK